MSHLTHDIVAKLWNLCNLLKDNNSANAAEDLPEPAVLAREALSELGSNHGRATQDSRYAGRIGGSLMAQVAFMGYVYAA